ncbi:metallophosphoesterase [Sulfurimonas paralvinellae]|uniref:Protein phosphatase n=1 Tax=Sulfurimonas paralvinellae TaxID=317658 RepID=A0A7M1B868_9BACT|nr:metallophosphoesterase [Sulfurimonas paralvinellae]QOP45865.1 protein phosphatase [Sulfurimonas paralvinellae]
MNQLIVYGDIHGCYDEFISLRKKINPDKSDIEVCVGDIITKGKNSVKLLKYIQEHNIKSVIGNHEDKLVRYLEHENFNIKNPISLDEDEKNIIENLDKQDIKFLKNLPLFFKYENITILHGGLQNYHNLNNLTKKENSKILRMRYLDTYDNFITYGKENEDSIFWADTYDGNQGFIVYGHQWFDEVKHSKFALGIDTGCVYGNKLSAVIFDNYNIETFKIISVKANNGK